MTGRSGESNAAKRNNTRQEEVRTNILDSAVKTAGKGNIAHERVAEEVPIHFKQMTDDNVVEDEKAPAVDESKNEFTSGEVIGSGKAAASGELRRVIRSNCVLKRVHKISLAIIGRDFSVGKSLNATKFSAEPYRYTCANCKEVKSGTRFITKRIFGGDTTPIFISLVSSSDFIFQIQLCNIAPIARRSFRDLKVTTLLRRHFVSLYVSHCRSPTTMMPLPSRVSKWKRLTIRRS